MPCLLREARHIIEQRTSMGARNEPKGALIGPQRIEIENILDTVVVVANRVGMPEGVAGKPAAITGNAEDIGAKELLRRTEKSLVLDEGGIVRRTGGRK